MFVLVVIVVDVVRAAVGVEFVAMVAEIVVKIAVV